MTASLFTRSTSTYPLRTERTEGRESIDFDNLKQLTGPAEKWITEHPAAALAAAFLVGVALACWIKRK
jgi:hypothetical protein